MSAQTATRRQRSGPVVALPTTALIYTRVSTEDQAREGLSLDAQLAACRRYAAERGWMLGQEYQDVLSGRRDDRPEYQQMLTGVRCLRAEGKPIAVVVAALDRFGRRVLERVRSREELKTLGVPVHSIKESGEVSDLVANILASVAQDESERTGARRRLKDAAIKLVDGDLDKAGYEAAKEAIEADLREAERQLEQLRPRLAPAERVIPFEEALAHVGGWTQALHTADVAAQRAVLADLLQTVTPIRTGYSTYRVKPEWTALGRHLADAAGAAAAGGSSSPQAG